MGGGLETTSYQEWLRDTEADKKDSSVYLSRTQGEDVGK